MNELPKTVDLNIPLSVEERAAAMAAAYQEHQIRMAHNVGVQSVERALNPGEAVTNAIEVSLWVNGREIRTLTDPATVQRIMAILAGIEP